MVMSETEIKEVELRIMIKIRDEYNVEIKKRKTELWRLNQHR